MRVMRTWNDNLDNVVRVKLFGDSELKQLMLIPEDKANDLRAFTTRYFTERVMGDELQIDEPVRVQYHTAEGIDFGNQHVRKKYLNFDIFVKEDRLHDCDENRMRQRTKMIAQKQKELQTDERCVCQQVISHVDDYSMACKTIGYVRYRIAFSYKVTH